MKKGGVHNELFALPLIFQEQNLKLIKRLREPI